MRRSRFPGGCSGMSLIEAVVTLAFMGIVLATAVIGLRGDFIRLQATVERFANDIRMARADATTRGAHYLVEIGSQLYEIKRLTDPDGDGIWTEDFDVVPRKVELPKGVSLTLEATSVPVSGIEFNTRGMLAPGPLQIVPELLRVVARRDDRDEAYTIEVWPSGQVKVQRGDTSG